MININNYNLKMREKSGLSYYYLAKFIDVLSDDTESSDGGPFSVYFALVYFVLFSCNYFINKKVRHV